MNTVIAPCERQTGATDVVGRDDAPARITTTLYDLLATMQAVVSPDEDELVVTTVVHWLRSGRITLLGEDGSLAPGGNL